MGATGAVVPSELPVGVDLRARAGSVVKPALCVVALFTIVTIAAKEWRPLYVAQPWQDDPCDVVVSFDFAVLPVLLALAAARTALCRAANPLPLPRLLGVLRVSTAAVGACLVTMGMEWAQTLPGQHRDQWNALTVVQLTVLTAFTALSVGSWLRLRRLCREALAQGPSWGQPDWLADGCTLVEQGLLRLLPWISWPRRVVRWVGDVPVAAVRRRPGGSAGVAAVALATPYVASKVVVEHYPAPLVALAALVSVAALFAVTVGLGSYLRIVERSVSRRAVVLAAGCAGGVAAFALHDVALLEQTAWSLAALFTLGAAAGAATAAITVNRQGAGRRA